MVYGKSRSDQGNNARTAEYQSDIIAGFCTETEEDHKDTLSIMEYSRYDMSYMFFYSERPGTLAERRYKDDIPEDSEKKKIAGNC